MIKSIAPIRKLDNYGYGHYQASRGKDRNGKPRKHNGEDHAVFPHSMILAPIDGEVTKLGYPYADDLSFRYVQITTRLGLNVRVFYIDPLVKVGESVNQNSIIGSVQDLSKRYSKTSKEFPNGITPHVHLEVKDLQGKFVNPKELGL